MTQDIQNKMEFLVRQTTEAPPVGALADNLSLPTNFPIDESDSGPDIPPPPKIRKSILHFYFNKIISACALVAALS